MGILTWEEFKNKKKDDIYTEFIRAIEVIGKGNQFTMFGFLSRIEFDKIVKIVVDNIIKDCEGCELRKEK